MTMRPSEIALAAGEIARSLAGRPVQKVVQPDERTLVLGFPHAWLLLTVDARHGRLHLLDDKPEATGEAAPAFCMLARKELVGARLDSVEIVGGERAVGLRFVRADGAKELRAFFFGVGGRLVLLGDGGVARGVLGSRTGPVELPPPRSDAGEPPRFGPSEIARFFAEQAARERREQARTQALVTARRELEKLRRLEKQLAGDLERAAAGIELRRHADLLLAHLADVPRGASEVTLPDDFTGGPPVRVKLDPAKSAQENAQRLYHDHKRRQRGRAVVEKRLTETREKRAQAETRLASIERGDVPALAAMQRKPAATQRAAKPGAQGPKPPYRAYRSASGMEILVGKGAAKNDELTFRVARGDDLWLHTRDVPGAHVVVPRPGRIEVDGETLLDAATLAVHHSPARDEGQADVTYAPRKLVHKPRGAAPGKVSVAGGKTLRLRMEPARLERLLATRRDDA